ncbi:MAG: hypothetical protein Q4E91_14370, partial [Lachnospiraceae bacterium]|nr:hypothetical protein [Lachnospiraceae bacterium]
MKSKYIGIMMGIVLTSASMGTVSVSYAADNTAEDIIKEEVSDTQDAAAAKSENENTIFGEVKSIENEKITLAVGTPKEMGAPQDPDMETPENPDAGTSALDFTGEELEITVTENTVITKTT